MVSHEAPHLRLILDDTNKNHDAENLATVWNPEDELHGYVELSSKEDHSINKITIYFEGVLRNWIAESLTRVIKAERKFLSQAHEIWPTTASRMEDSQRGNFPSKVPFHFIISRVIPRTNDESPDQCLQLPPSLDLGDSLIDRSTGRRFGQPSINYFLRADMTVTFEGRQKQLLQAYLPVTIVPYTEELPPTETKDFPMEFKETESKALRKSLLGNMLGTMHISLQEPPAITYGRSCTHGSTEAILKLEFEAPTSSTPSDISNLRAVLKELRFMVYSLVRVKTFYSIKPFLKLPGQSLMGDLTDTRLCDGIIKLQTRTVDNVSWGYRYLSLDQSDTLASPGAGASCSVAKALDQGKTKASIPSGISGKWISNWTIPIEVNERILPNFCTSMAARVYSLIVRVKITGARVGNFDLEVPFQVIHSPHNEFGPSTIMSVRERFLEYRTRLDSEILCFNDESLDSEQSPPEYYP